MGAKIVFGVKKNGVAKKKQGKRDKKQKNYRGQGK